MPYNPWDQGTRYEGKSDPEAMAGLLQQLGAVGFNGDTMSYVNQSFYSAGLPLGEHIAIEPELGGNHSTMFWSTTGWGYWPSPGEKGWGSGPPVDAYKWLDGRRMTAICNRWAQNHTIDLMQAFFNGIAFVPWQNVWTVYNRMTPRDAEALRRMASMERFLGQGTAMPPLLRSRDWEPYVVLTTEADTAGIRGSVFPMEHSSHVDPRSRTLSMAGVAGSNASATVYTFIGWGGADYQGPVIELYAGALRENLHAFDCYRGEELYATAAGTLSIDVEAGGFGCILLTTNSTDTSAELDGFLAAMKAMTGRPLSSYDSVWRYT